MGTQVRSAIERSNGAVVLVGTGSTQAIVGGGAGGETPDVIIDFSSEVGAVAAAGISLAHRTPLLVATTGLSDAARSEVLAVALVAPVMLAPNTSLGVAVMRRLVREAARCLPRFSITISETHHTRKRDRPSGTALSLAEAAREGGNRSPSRDEIEVIREGEVIGHHEVHLTGSFERLSLVHDAQDRALFAEGALHLAAWLVKQPPGAWTPDDWLDSGGHGRLSTTP